MAEVPLQPDLREHFAAILGRKVADISHGEVQLRERTAVWSLAPGAVTEREIGTTGNSTKGCGGSLVFSIGGITATGIGGSAEFLLSEFYCPQFEEILPHIFTLDFPIIFVATVQSSNPGFVTTRTSEITDTNGDITDWRIEIFTWEPGGSPSAGLVKWFCQIPLLATILIKKDTV
jgi:hypothetical protein